jgi:hypothetical protein
MRLAMVFVAGFLCAVVVVLAAGQAPSELGRYQIAPGWETSQGMLFQLDTYTGRVYAREWYLGRVHDLGTLDRPLAMPGATATK